MKIPCIRALIVIAVIIITIIIIMPICKTCAVIITHPDYTLLELFNIQYVCLCVSDAPNGKDERDLLLRHNIY